MEYKTSCNLVHSMNCCSHFRLYTKLELAGALFLMSVYNIDDLPPELRKLIADGKDDISDELDDLQYRVWERNGRPEVRIVTE